MRSEISQLISAIPATGWLVIGAVVTAGICAALTRKALTVCETPTQSWPLITTFSGLVLGAMLAYSMHQLHCQATPVVRPSETWQDLRIVYHSICLGLLLVITATDLASLYIPNFVVKVGLVVAIVGAFVSGELQLEHLWVDWNEEIPQIRGPYIPDWIKQHEHWHGLSGSVVGALVGASLTALVRKIATIVLGRPAMGSGDITLMAMIGAFLGWQAAVIAFSLAPLLALILGPLARKISREAAVPYGPFLAFAAIIVMFSWKWIWMFEVDISISGATDVDDRAMAFAVRRLFGDGVLLAGLGGVAFGGTAGLMCLLRLFWSLPIEREAAASDPRITPPTSNRSVALETPSSPVNNDSCNTAPEPPSSR